MKRVDLGRSFIHRVGLCISNNFNMFNSIWPIIGLGSYLYSDIQLNLLDKNSRTFMRASHALSPKSQNS